MYGAKCSQNLGFALKSLPACVDIANNQVDISLWVESMFQNNNVI